LVPEDASLVFLHGYARAEGLPQYSGGSLLLIGSNKRIGLSSVGRGNVARLSGLRVHGGNALLPGTRCDFAPRFW